MSDVVMPLGWIQAEIGELCDLINGRAFKPAEWSDEGLPIIRIQNLNNPNATFNYFDGELTDKHRIMYGDLLFAWSGTPGTSFGAHVWKGGEAALNQHIFKVDFDESGIDKRFLQYAINQTLDELIAGAHGGVGLRHVTKGKFEKTRVAFPPSEEQRAISDKLDGLLAQTNNLKVRLDTIPAILKRFRQSVLAAAVSGRLTSDWRAVMTNIKTLSLEKISYHWEEKLRSEGKRYKRLQLSPSNERDETLPDRWVKTQLGYVFSVYVGATPSRSETAFWNGDIPWVSSAEVAFCRISDTKEKVTQKGLRSASTELHPEGTVMLAMIGQGKTRGQPAILGIEACHNQNTAALEIPTDFCVPEFLYYYLCEKYEETRMVGGGNNQMALNKKKVQELPFPLPPFEEQAEIVRRVDQFFAFADQIEQQVKNAQARVDKLTQSILAKAFRGELTAEWRSANPELISGENSGEALLERIKAEKVKKPVGKGRGRKSVDPNLPV